MQQALNLRGHACMPTRMQRRGRVLLAASHSSSSAPASTTRGPAQANIELLRAVFKQARTEVWPQVRDLVEPWLQPAPKPLTGTVDPQELAEPDSLFTRVDGVLIHYKDQTYTPGGLKQERMAGSSSSGGSSAGVRTTFSDGMASVGVSAAAGSSMPDASSNIGTTTTSGNTSTTISTSSSAEDPLTILFVHGFNGSTFNFRFSMPDIATALAAKTNRPVRVIAFDRPPFGLSGRPLIWDDEADNPYTQAAGARFAEGLLVQLGVSSAVVVGHSAGAGVSVDLALRRSDLVSALVLAAPALSVDPKGFLARANFGQLLRFAASRALLGSDGPGLHYIRKQIEKRRDAVLRGEVGMFADEGAVDDATLEGYLKPLKAHDWDRASLLMYRSFNLGGALPDYDALVCPALIVQGERDQAIPREQGIKVADRLRQRPAGAGSAAGSRDGSTGSSAGRDGRDGSSVGSSGRDGGGGRSSSNTSSSLGRQGSDVNVLDGSAANGSTSFGGPATHYVELAQSGHIPMEERPAEFAAAVVDFVGQLAGAHVKSVGTAQARPCTLLAKLY